MKLTREEAIAKFREHWLWLSEHPEAEKWEAPMIDDEIKSYCFLCHYCNQNSVPCSKCPIEWPSDASRFTCEHKEKNMKDDDGLWLQWERAHRNKDYKLASALALQIANLPEREVQHDRP